MTTTDSGVRDFDFLAGKWRVRHRKLVDRLAGSTEWREFTGASESFHVMGRTALVDDNFLDDPTGAYRAASLRHFDAKADISISDDKKAELVNSLLIVMTSDKESSPVINLGK